MLDSTRGIGRLVRGLGLLLYGVIGAVPFLGSALVVPWPVALALWAVWIVGLVVAVRQSAAWPWAATVTTIAALLTWVIVVQAGSLLFGWNA